MDVVYTIFPNWFIKICVNDKRKYWKSAAMTYGWQRLAVLQTPYSVVNEIRLLCRYNN